jgi:acetylglutamate kinase
MSNHDPLPADLEKAATLVEALPYLQRYAGCTFVIKYGGHAMGESHLAEQFAKDVVLLKKIGIDPVVVHGGGPQIGKMLQRLNISSNFIDGLRVTDTETAAVAEMVLAGSINKEVVHHINRAGGSAVGLSGKDAHLMTVQKVQRARKDPDSHIEQVVDLGFVGEPVKVNTHVLDVLRQSDLIPVIAPIGVDAAGDTYNINADTMAGAIAGALKATRLFLLTDVAGVLDANKQLLTDLTPTRIRGLIDEGVISGGMIPKVETCMQAVAQGAEAVVILDGRVPHAMLLEIFTQRGAGTMVRAG